MLLIYSTYGSNWVKISDTLHADLQAMLCASRALTR